MERHTDKKGSRLRRARRGRAKIKELRVHRLCVHRTPRHIYVQLISPDGSRVLASASTLDKELREAESSEGGKIAEAIAVGRLIAERGKIAGITKVAFDRSGFKYHGRVKALADAAREHGLEF
jgi:large subunit ribosomal protein L18